MATKEKVQLVRSAVLSLMYLGGWSAAGKWSNEKLERKISEIPDMLEEGKDLEDADAETLLSITAGLEDGADFEVIDDPKGTSKKKPKQAAAEEDEDEEEDDDSDFGTAKQKKARAEADDDDEDDDEEEDEAEEDAEEEDSAEEEAPKKKTKKAKAEAKAPKTKKVKPARAKKERTGPEGVRPTRSRFYLAAQVIKKHGLKAGVTDAMVAEVDEMVGRKNDRQTRFCMANAWHTLNGYLGTYPVEEDEADEE